MTVLQLYEAVLIELNKVKAPSLSLSDFIYFANKSIQQFANYSYNAYEMTQQQTDDLRSLRATAKLEIKEVDLDTDATYNHYTKTDYDPGIQTWLPDDYWHILNCSVEFIERTPKCGSAKHILVGARKLNTDAAAQVENNYYFRPSYKNPYFYISNKYNREAYYDGEHVASFGNIFGKLPEEKVINMSVNEYLLKDGETYKLLFRHDRKQDSKLNPPIIISLSGKINQMYRTLLKEKNSSISELVRSLNVKYEDDERIYVSSPYLYEVQIRNKQNGTFSAIGTTSKHDFQRDRVANTRYGNPTRSRIDIRCGDRVKYQPSYVFIDYLRAPQYVTLTQEQIDDKEDNSQLLEFADYICYEIVNWIVKLILENTSNPRLANAVGVNQSISSPGGTSKA